MARSVGQRTSIQDRSGYIAAEAVALGAMALVTERGPIGESREVTSWPEFQALYGDHVSGYVGTRCAKRALDAGCALRVSRVVHYSDIADSATKTSAAASVTVRDRSSVAGRARVTGSATFPVRLAHGDTFIVSVDRGSNLTATFNAYARRLTASGGTHAGVTGGHSLVLVVNGVQRAVAFAGSENSADLFAAAINIGIPGVYADVSSGNVRITTDKKGTGAALSVHASTDADVLASLGFTSGQASSSLGSSNVADIEAVTAAEFESVVEGAVTGSAAGADADGHPYVESTTTGSGSYVQVINTSTADDEFGFGNAEVQGASVGVNTLAFTASSDGTWAHGTRVVIDDDPGEPSTRFRVRITTAAGVVLETHDRLSMSSTDPRYVVSVLRDESIRYRVVNQNAATVAPNNRPLAGTYTPSGGSDGLASLAYTDYIGHATTRTGLHAFDPDAHFRLASCPGVTDHDAHVAGTAWAANLTEVRYVGTIPYAITTVANAKAFRRRESPYASGTAIDSAYGALYAGWHRVIDPRTREELWIPSEGEVYAALAAATKESGPWLPMAGSKRAKLSIEVRELRVAPGPDDVEAMVRTGVNPFYNDPSDGFVIEGQATLQRTPSQLDRLNACLLVDFIGEQVREGNRPDRHEPNDTILWRGMKARTEKFMERLAQKRGTIERDDQDVPRFRVECGSSNNPPEERAAKRTHIDVFVVPQGASEEQEIGIVVLPPGATA